MFKIKNAINAFIIIGMLPTAFFTYKSYKISKNILQQISIQVKPEKKVDLRLHSPINRPEFIKKIDLSKKSLEIGPFFCPVLKGENVKYFDVLNKDDLLKKLKSDPVVKYEDHCKNVAYIDFVEPTGDMSVIKEKFDIVFSSHNIEHQVDLVRHLKQVEELLTSGGKFYLFVPDKRYCFDNTTPESNISNVLAVYSLKEKVHNLQNILSMRCEITHNESIKHWSNDHGLTKGEQDVNCYKNALKEYFDSKGQYIDSHKWRFTPESFYKIVKALSDLGYINFEIETIYDTEKNSHEFQAILKKKAK